jgi:hypothetical protein
MVMKRLPLTAKINLRHRVRLRLKGFPWAAEKELLIYRKRRRTSNIHQGKVSG